MKHRFFFFLFLSIFCNSVLGQTGTIKIAKPAKKDTYPIDSLIAKRNPIIYLGTNYTLKNNNKVGFDIGYTVRFRRLSFIRFSLQYSIENQYYELSMHNKRTGQIEIPYKKSQNQSQYIKMPIGINRDISAGWLSIIYIGISPEYLLENKNEHNRLNINDFYQFNLSGTVGLIKDMNPKMELKLEYSKDFFENLKDRNIYDSSGSATGKQKSKTNLLSLTICYKFMK